MILSTICTLSCNKCGCRLQAFNFNSEPQISCIQLAVGVIASRGHTRSYARDLVLPTSPPPPARGTYATYVHVHILDWRYEVLWRISRREDIDKTELVSSITLLNKFKY